MIEMRSGFYKADGDKLLYAPEGVYGPDFTLLMSKRDEYTYPVNGWTWFNDPEEAITTLGVPVQGVASDGSISSLDFIERFTDAEAEAIIAATMQNPIIKLWYDKLLAAQSVHATDSRVIAGMSALVAAGLLTDARKDEILAW